MSRQQEIIDKPYRAITLLRSKVRESDTFSTSLCSMRFHDTLTTNTHEGPSVDISTSGDLHYWILSKGRSIYKTDQSVEINNIALAPAMLLNKANLSLLLLVQQAAQVLVEIEVTPVVSDAVVAVGVRPPAHLLRADTVTD